MRLRLITGSDTQREHDGDILVNDPTRVTDGSELSDDPIMRVPTYVYGESVRRRSGATRPATLSCPARRTGAGITPSRGRIGTSTATVSG